MDFFAASGAGFECALAASGERPAKGRLQPVTLGTSLLALLLFLTPLVGWGQGAPAAALPAPVIVNRFGETLQNARIVKFDGETFHVEHDGGVAAITWTAMPEPRRLGYTYDSDRASVERERNEERARDAQNLAVATAATAAAVEAAAPPRPTPAPPPLIVERDLRIGDLYYLSTIGGPNAMLRIRRISQTEITFARDKFGSVTVERKLGFNEPRTLLFSDGRGCDVYWVERVDPDRDRYSTTVQFEYAPGARSRPR